MSSPPPSDDASSATELAAIAPAVVILPASSSTSPTPTLVASTSGSITTPPSPLTTSGSFNAATTNVSAAAAPTTAAAVPPTASAPSSTPSYLKKFTHAQIAEKVSKRSVSVPEYHSLLMSCKIRSDTEGVIFDSTHPSWSVLLHLCTIADTLEREAKNNPTLVANAAAYERGDMSAYPPEPIVVLAKDYPLPPSAGEGKKKTANAASNSTIMPATPTNVRKGSGSGSGKKKASGSQSLASSPSLQPSNAERSSSGGGEDGEQEEWVNVKMLKGANGGEAAQLRSPLSSAAASIFSQTAMSRAASALDKFSKIITARPPAERRSSTVKSQHQPAQVTHTKSSSNSSRDVTHVKEDLDFEAMIHREYEATEESNATSIAATATATAAVVGTAGATGATAIPAGAASKDHELLAEFIRLIHPKDGEQPDIPAIKAVCKVIGVPHKHRGQLWNVLLGVRDTLETSGTETGDFDAPSRDRIASLTEQRPISNDPNDSASNGSDLTPIVASDSTTSPTTSDPSAVSTSTGAPASESPSSSTKFNLHNQRVIRADIERTLPHLLTFQKPQIRHDMEVILTQYCQRHEVSYKQGMNFILAPFFLLGLPSRDAIYRLYEKFITKLLNNTYIDNDFGSLQCTFLLFQLTLQYHDPELALFLNENDMGPELYASSWFITLWSNRCKMSVLFYLWDCLILDNNYDQQLAFWCSLALLIHHRQQLLHEQIVMLPETLSKLTISSKKEASILVNRAKKLYRAQASITMREQLRDITSRMIRIDSIDYQRLLNQQVLVVSEEELVRACYGEIKLGTKTTTQIPTQTGSTNTTSTPTDSTSTAASTSNSTTTPSCTAAPSTLTVAPPATPVAAATITSSPVAPIKFFILDCRPLDQYEAGHLPCAYHLDPELLSQPSNLIERVDSLTSMRGCHFCFLAEGGFAPTPQAGLSQSFSHTTQVTITSAPSTKSSAIVKAFIQVFLKKGFKYLSNCEGGYAAAHALIMASDHSLELIDHNVELCLECTGRRKARTVPSDKKRTKGFMSSVLQKITGISSTDLTNASESETEEEWKAQNLPDSALVLLPSHDATSNGELPAVGASALSLRLLHTVIRDRNTDVSSFSDALHRLTAILVATFLERVEVKEKNVSTGAGFHTGITSTPTCTITTNSIALELLDSAFHPYRPVCNRQSAVYRFEAIENSGTPSSASASTPTSSASGSPNDASQLRPHLLRHITVPSNLLESNILLFFPILTPNDAAQLFDILADLIHTRSAALSQITVVAILAARPILWRLADAYPDILIITSGVDELIGQRLVPGVNNLEERFNSAK